MGSFSIYRIAYQTRLRLSLAPMAPARLEAIEGRGHRVVVVRSYQFLGGYGDDNRRPTQEGCAKLAAWMDRQGLRETPLSLIAAFDSAMEDA